MLWWQTHLVRVVDAFRGFEKMQNWNIISARGFCVFCIKNKPLMNVSSDLTESISIWNVCSLAKFGSSTFCFCL